MGTASCLATLGPGPDPWALGIEDRFSKKSAAHQHSVSSNPSARYGDISSRTSRKGFSSGSS